MLISCLRPWTVIPKVKIARATMIKVGIAIFILENIW